MGATILESLSNIKLVGIITLLLTIQLVSFYIGAFWTPSPSSFEQFTSVHCHRHDRNKLAIPRYKREHEIDVSHNCERSGSPLTTFGHVHLHHGHHSSDSKKQHGDFDTTTFAVQLPLPRDGMNLAYSRWMQTLLVLLMPEFQYEPLLAESLSKQDHEAGHHSHSTGDKSDSSKKSSDNSFPLLIDVSLAVKNKDDHEWTIYAKRQELRRTLKFPANDLDHSHKMDCEPIQLFELQSLHYDYYLINFEIHEDKNSNHTYRFPGRLNEITGVAIHHNGGFTQIWLLLKIFFFITTLATLIWYCRRLRSLTRNTILIERLLIGLGATLTQLNFPFESLTLYFDLPFMMFLNDLRQGVFYCVLLSFWIIFVGEHLLDGNRKNSQLACYVKELLAICVASLALLVFDLSERGIQAVDPFMTIWESDPELANLSITIASCACLAYLCFLLYYIYLAFNTISGKQSALPKMQLTKRLKYQGMIYRFKFLLCATTVCAISTLVFYGLSHRNDWSYDEEMAMNANVGGGSMGSIVEWTSAMLTTVCAMWNLYVIALMILYAPSYKNNSGGYMSDHIEFDCLTDERNTDEPDYTEVTDIQLLQDMTDKVVDEKNK